MCIQTAITQACTHAHAHAHKKLNYTHMHVISRALKTTKFCLCPRGNKAWSPRLMDALWFGCIPVLIADYYVPPGYGLIPWQLISVSVAEKDVCR